MIIDLPDPTSTPPPTPAKRTPQPKTPRYVPTYIRDVVDDEIKIYPDSGYISIGERYSEAWRFTPDQALAVAHAILGYVNEITGQRYAVGKITRAAPSFIYSPDDDMRPS